MIDQYKGESPSKKLARLFYWNGIQKELGVKRLREKKHLILVSRIAGDIPVLLTMGVPPKNIIAVDINPNAAYAAQEKYPQVRIICGDITKIVKEYRREIATAYLDFCDCLSQQYISKVMEVVKHGLSEQAILGCTFLCGREKDTNLLIAIEKCKKELLEDNRNNDLNFAAISRCTVLFGRLAGEGMKVRIYMKPREALYYMSSTKSSHGVPMCIASLNTLRAPIGTSVEKIRAKTNASIGEFVDIKLKDCNIDDGTLRSMILSQEADMRSRGDVEGLRLLADAYNIDSSTIAAWKAHASRGTYR